MTSLSYNNAQFSAYPFVVMPLNLKELSLVSGGNDEAVDEVVAEVVQFEEEVVAELEAIVTEVKEEISHLVGFSLSRLNFGCCS